MNARDTDGRSKIYFDLKGNDNKIIKLHTFSSGELKTNDDKSFKTLEVEIDKPEVNIKGYKLRLITYEVYIGDIGVRVQGPIAIRDLMIDVFTQDDYAKIEYTDPTSTNSPGGGGDTTTSPPPYNGGGGSGGGNPGTNPGPTPGQPPGGGSDPVFANTGNNATLSSKSDGFFSGYMVYIIIAIVVLILFALMAYFMYKRSKDNKTEKNLENSK